MRNSDKLNNNVPFNELPLLPPNHAKIETIAVLRQELFELLKM